MVTLFQKTGRIRQSLFFYWLLVPMLFASYLVIMSVIQKITIADLLTTIPSLAISLIVALLQIFQAFGLYSLRDVAETRGSLLGTYLKFSLVQQLLTLNFIGLLLCCIYFWRLQHTKKSENVASGIKIPLYLLMTFVSILTLLVLIIRFSM